MHANVASALASKRPTPTDRLDTEIFERQQLFSGMVACIEDGFWDALQSSKMCGPLKINQWCEMFHVYLVRSISKPKYWNSIKSLDVILNWVCKFKNKNVLQKLLVLWCWCSKVVRFIYCDVIPFWHFYSHCWINGLHTPRQGFQHKLSRSQFIEYSCQFIDHIFQLSFFEMPVLKIDWKCWFVITKYLCMTKT